MPRNGPIALGLRKEFDRLVSKHGVDALIPLYEENGVYNFYIKKQGSEPVRSLAVSPIENQPGNDRQGNP